MDSSYKDVERGHFEDSLNRLRSYYDRNSLEDYLDTDTFL